jgi:hypothetical protein
LFSISPPILAHALLSVSSFRNATSKNFRGYNPVVPMEQGAVIFEVDLEKAKVRSPIPWEYGVFYIVYYWMIFTAIL